MFGVRGDNEVTRIICDIQAQQRKQTFHRTHQVFLKNDLHSAGVVDIRTFDDILKSIHYYASQNDM